MLIYLAGCMSYYYENNEPQKAEHWRDIAKERLKDIEISTFDPTLHYKNNYLYDSDLMVQQNEYYLKKTDIILVNLDDLDKSYGTIYELVYAHTLGKQILAFGDNTIKYHPHIKHILTNHFDNLNEVLDFINTAYCQ